MSRFKLAFILSTFLFISYSQNDVDAIRYSRIGGGGSARFISMGGAFGAVGADLSCAAYNPAGLGVFRKGELSFSAGFRATNNSADIYKKTSSVFDLNGNFNNVGFAYAWKAANDPDSRHVFSIVGTQLQNFNNSTSMSGYTNSSSLGKDMLNLAVKYQSPGNNITGNLNSSYEGLGFNAFLLDTANNNFFSFEDPKRTVKQTRSVVTAGRVNDWNLSYAYSYKDKFYLGASLGLPQVSYESTTTHTEEDDKDSMRVTVNPANNSYSTTYVDDLPVIYNSRLGFKNLVYTEYFKTTGSGVNLKLGGIVRLNDLLRIGLYYHTPTIYSLSDTYYNNLTVTFDKPGSTPDNAKDPPAGGYYQYKIITPGKISANAAFIIKKLAVIGIDYEITNYRNAQLSGGANANSFADANTALKTYYTTGQNLRVGAELNLNPLMLRAGYNMQGSPFGKVFVGDFVRNTFSAGFGFRTKNNFYFDFVVYKTLSKENYYLFTTLNTMSKIRYNSTTLSATIGVKF